MSSIREPQTLTHRRNSNKKTDIGERCRVAMTGLRKSGAILALAGLSVKKVQTSRTALTPHSSQHLNSELLENADQLDQRQSN